MSLATDVKAFMVADAAVNGVVSGRVHYNWIPQNSPRPHIWFQRSEREEALTMDNVGGLVRTTFDVECNSTSLSEAHDLADKVNDLFHGHSGPIVNTTSQLAQVDSQQEDYVPRNNDADETIHSASLRVSIWHVTT